MAGKASGGLADPLNRPIIKDGPVLAWPVNGDVQDEAVVLGWQASYHPDERLSFEATFSRLTDSLRQTRDSGQQLAFDWELWSLSASARYGVTLPSGWYLYLGVGAGYYVPKTSGEALDPWPTANEAGGRVTAVSVAPKKSFGTHALAGLEWRLAPRWELFLEYRQIWLESKIAVNYRTEQAAGANQPPLVGQRTESESFPYDHGLLRLGLNFRF